MKLTASGLRTPVHGSSTTDEPTPLKSSTQFKSTLLKKSNARTLQSESVTGEAIIHDDLDEAFSNLTGLSVITLYNCIDLISSLEESREHFFKAGAMQILWCRLLTASSSTVQQIGLATEMLLNTCCCMSMLGRYYTGMCNAAYCSRFCISNCMGPNKINPFTPNSAKLKTEEKILNFILQRCKKQTAPLESTVQ